MTRHGKIARLPKQIRLQLNRRLEDGQPGTQLVAWLNGLPDAQAVLTEQFAGHPISPQNLSEWKQGGYLDWLRHEESCDQVQRLAELAQDLAAHADGRPISDHLATLLSLELVRVSESLLQDCTDPQQRWQGLRQLVQLLTPLRQGDHRAARLRLEQERWDWQKDRVAEPKHQTQTKDLPPAARAPMATPPNLATPPSPIAEDQISPNLAAHSLEAALAPSTFTGASPTGLTPSNPLKLNQTQSHQINPPLRLPKPKPTPLPAQSPPHHPPVLPIPPIHLTPTPSN